VVLPELTAEGELPPGVHIADWQEFQSRFCSSSPRRGWLSGRFRTLLELAATGGELRRVFVWSSFVTSQPAPRDIDILLIVDEDFEVARMSLQRELSSIPYEPSCCSNPMSSGREPPSGTRCCIFGWTLIKSPEASGNEVLWR
jgi:hypothetical protein